jgi:hypothetical protein
VSTAISASDWKRLGKGLPAAAPPSKYRNTKVKGFDKSGAVITLDSKREAKRWAELLILEKQGIISQLERQVPFHFSAAGKFLLTYSRRSKAKYVLDFRYWHEKLGDWVHEDAKGKRTELYKWKCMTMLWIHGIEIREV